MVADTGYFEYLKEYYEKSLVPGQVKERPKGNVIDAFLQK